MTGKTFPLYIDTRITIYDIMAKIQELEKIPTALQRLLFGTRQLDCTLTSKSLAVIDNQISEGDTITLIEVPFEETEDYEELD